MIEIASGYSIMYLWWWTNVRHVGPVAHLAAWERRNDLAVCGRNIGGWSRSEGSYLPDGTRLCKNCSKKYMKATGRIL